MNISRDLIRSTLAIASLCALSLAQDPTPASTTDRPTLPDGLQAALAIQQHFQAVAETAYRFTVTVTGYAKDAPATDGQSFLAVPSPVATAPVATATDLDDEREGGGWVAETSEELYPGYHKIGIGSGFAVTADGEFLTCLHPLQKPDGSFADLIDVETPDQQNTICRLVAAEPTLDLALLKLEVYDESFPPQFGVAEWGDSGALRPGHYAIGVGAPFGPEQVFAVGHVTSPPDRDCYQENMTATYLQTSLRLHPEAYGGPLLNVQGEVVGLLMPREIKPGTTELLPGPGLEFALPSNILVNLYESLRKVQSSKSPWLGFAVMSRAELRKEFGPGAYNLLMKPRFGIYIENVFDPSAAKQAGLEPGDFLVRFDGEFVQTPVAFQRCLYLAGIGADVELEIYRRGETFTRRLRIEERPKHATQR